MHLVVEYLAMYTFGVLITFIIFTVDVSESKLDTGLMLAYFEHKFCNAGVIFSCSTKKEKITLAKYFSENYIKTSIHDVTDHQPPLEAILRKNGSHLVVIVDADCYGTEQLLQKSARLESFYDSYHWLVLGSFPNATENFREVELVINADVDLAIPYENNQTWTVLDVYNPSYKNGGQLIVKEVGYYNEKDGYRVPIKENKYFIRKNMTGTLFTSAVVIPENISMSLTEYLEYDEDRKNNTFSRFQTVVIQNCQDFFNFQINRSVVHSWGYLLPNGDVDGMLKEIKEKRIDFGSAPLMFKEYRLRIMDYGYGTWIMSSGFVFQNPKNTLSSYELYLRPLETGVWISTSLTLILIVLICKVISMREDKVFKGKHKVNPVESSWSFLIVYSIGELCQQGFGYVPLFASGKILVTTVLFFFFLIYQFYSASIVSYLLMEPPTKIKTLLDLLNSNLKVGCENSLYDKDYIASTTDPVALELYDKKMKGTQNLGFYSPQDGLEKVQAGGFAFHTQISTAYPIIESQFPEKVICELRQVQMYATQTLYMTLPKKSPLKEMFNYCTIHQMEVGVLQRLRKHWIAHKPQCVDHTMYLEIKVGLEESYWALILLGVGVTVGAILLILERAWIRGKKKISLMKLNNRKLSMSNFGKFQAKLNKIDETLHSTLNKY